MSAYDIDTLILNYVQDEREIITFIKEKYPSMTILKKSMNGAQRTRIFDNFRMLVELYKHYYQLEAMLDICESIILDSDEIRESYIFVKNFDDNIEIDTAMQYIFMATDQNIEQIDAFIKDNSIKYVILYGPVKCLPDFFCSCTYLVSCTYFLYHLTSAGSSWMANCNELMDPRFNGLIALKNIGHGWMAGCKKLKTPNFNGLVALECIGDQWMSNCDNLSDPCFNGLEALKSVGCMWMYRCMDLRAPNFSGLTALESVDVSWMSKCYNLVNPNFSGMDTNFSKTILSKRDEFSWMWECDRLRIA